MLEINPIQPTNNVQPLTIEQLEEMDEASIFNKLDTDQSGTITNQELTVAGYIKEELFKIKNYLIERFGRDKITNVEPGEKYFDYKDGERQVQKPKSLDKIPLGSHPGIRDARGCDISGLHLSEKELLNLCIDKTTIMSPEQKAIIDAYTEKTKDPGLGIRNLHEQGITGKGVRMAIIDQPLGKHTEYSSNIIYQDDINSKDVGWNNAEMHGAAIASIAVGKECGVAPDADLIYFSAVNLSYDPKDIEEYHRNIQEKIEQLKSPESKKRYKELKAEYKKLIKAGANKDLIKQLANEMYKFDSSRIKELKKLLELNERDLKEVKIIEKQLKKATDEEEINFLKNMLESNKSYLYYACTNKPYADAINKILDMNKNLPDNEKVQVISISWGFDDLAPGYKELQDAIQRAKDEGVFIVSTSLEEHYGMDTGGANRDPKGDLNSPDAYEAGAYWKDFSDTKEGKRRNNPDTLLLVPMDHRTVADFTDGTSYRYEGNDGGMSWSTPWLAGMYVLAKQVKPNITPEEFWRVAMETSDECHNNDTETYVGRIINPQKLIETLQKQ